MNTKHNKHSIIEYTKTRLYYIDGLKGLLCLFIMFGHYWNIFRGCKGNLLFYNSFLESVNSSIIGKTFLSATFWLYAFLVISGYLLYDSKINTFKELFQKSIYRFLRFFLPVLGACIFIFCIQETIGFYANETSAYFTNNWFQKYYQIKLHWSSILKETLHALFSDSCKFNAPYWVISDMFFSSLIIYICNYIDNVTQQRNSFLPTLFFISAIVIDNHVMAACLAGYLTKYFQYAYQQLTKKPCILLLFTIAVLSNFLLIKSAGILPKVFDKISFYIIFYCFILIWIEQLSALQKIFSMRIFLSLGKISFGIFSFHWPIICSFGSLLLIQGIEKRLAIIPLYFLIFFICLLFTIIISIIYYHTVEKVSGKIIRHFNTFFH